MRGGLDGKVDLWDVSDRRLEETLSNVNLASVTDVAFSPDGRTLAAASKDRVCLWDTVSREPRAYPTGLAKGNDLRVAFSPDGRRIAVGGGHGTVQLWKNPA